MRPHIIEEFIMTPHLLSKPVHYFLNKYCFEYRKEVPEIPDAVLKQIMAYYWPGNVRELENVVRMAIALKDWEFVFRELDLETHPKERPSSGEDSGLLIWSDEKIKKRFEEKNFSLKKIAKAYVSEIEREAILNALKETDWNRKKAAQILQVSYKTLRNRIRELNLKSK